jgi:phospholipase C
VGAQQGRFFRAFAGDAAANGLQVRAWYVPRHQEVVLRLDNGGSEPLVAKIRDGYKSRAATVSLRPGKSETRHWVLSRTRGWYDLLVTVDGDADFAWRYAGHVENGEESISDPLMGSLI